METDHTAQPSEQPSALSLDEIDPHSYLRLQMRVIGGQRLTLGTVEALDRDAATGRLMALTVRHGLFRNKHTSVPVKQVKWVNQNSVVLQVSRAAFKQLPRAASH
jgi:hypothetical protein